MRDTGLVVVVGSVGDGFMRKSDSSDDLSRASMSTNADEKMEMVEKECEEWKAKSKDLEEKYRELQGQLQWAKKDSEEKASVAKRKYELLERSHEMLKKETTGDKDLKERCCMLEGESEAVARKNEELEKKVEKLKATLKYLL
ncbi:uncharacterized protein J4E88_002471 [Alternaria novae-zelandiae]|uniref:uncharacterized protein n=1 Tax=Alternaria novae-zelandiae TaxID=430562 RepID=UPI0020C2CA74|nr:uncharacterized protein J4E88_002471 [Alternaria novae-zelandiae]KAI4690994.1 hypothetical protein J4E88_002471 [Alternaria novae-zelandiae]